MSGLGQTRLALANALSTVDGVTGHEYRPPALKGGDAWPLQGPGDRGAGSAFMITWVVRVVMPSDERAAAEWWDEHWPALFWAIETVGFVDRFAPVAVPTSAGDILAHDITLRAGE